MKILFLSSVLPHHRVISGFYIVHQRIKHLAERGYEIGLASFIRDDNEQWMPRLRPMVSELEVLPVPPPRPVARRVANAIMPRMPPDYLYLYTDEMRRLVGNMVQRSHYDVVIAEFTVMGQFLRNNPYLPAVKRIVSCHSCYTTMLTNEINLNRWTPTHLWQELVLPRLRTYEFDIYRSADHVLTLTPEERYNLISYRPDLHISVVPSGVDVSRFTPCDKGESENILLFTGYFHHEANRDAAIWFAQSVWPKLKERYADLRLYYVGRDPTPAMKLLSKRDPAIVVTGEVPDLQPYLEKARIFVNPVRLGSGLRGKIFQAMAAGIPVVSTTLGAEGIAAHTGHDIMLADDAGVMVQQIDLLLSEPELRKRIACNARELIDSRYTWEQSIDSLENVLHSVVN